MSVLEYAPAMYKALNGVFCIYKPPGQAVQSIIYSLKAKLAGGLGSLLCLDFDGFRFLYFLI